MDGYTAVRTHRILSRRCHHRCGYSPASKRLPHARAIAADVLATARAQRWDRTEVIKALLTKEVAGRVRSMLASRRIAAGFPTGKTFDAWDPGASSIPPPTQQALQTPEWIHRRENPVVCGPAGTGKTLFLEALGQKVIEARIPVSWFALGGACVGWRARSAPTISPVTPIWFVPTGERGSLSRLSDR